MAKFHSFRHQVFASLFNSAADDICIQRRSFGLMYWESYSPFMMCWANATKMSEEDNVLLVLLYFL